MPAGRSAVGAVKLNGHSGPAPPLTSPPTENGRDESEGFKQREWRTAEERYVRQPDQKHNTTR